MEPEHDFRPAKVSSDPIACLKELVSPAMNYYGLELSGAVFEDFKVDVEVTRL